VLYAMMSPGPLRHCIQHVGPYRVDPLMSFAPCRTVHS
jgi:hypothetical protein